MRYRIRCATMYLTSDCWSSLGKQSLADIKSLVIARLGPFGAFMLSVKKKYRAERKEYYIGS